jgi:hypothetical protein
VALNVKRLARKRRLKSHTTALPARHADTGDAAVSRHVHGLDVDLMGAEKRVCDNPGAAKEGKMDYAGMMAGYSQFFGTKDQPNKPARTTVQVVLPAGARGGLIEIDLVAVGSKPRP